MPLIEAAAAVGLEFLHERGERGEKHLPETMGAGLAWLDYDGDGWQDLYVVQSGPFPPVRDDRPPDRLFRNRGGGRFEEVTARAGVGGRDYGQGVTAADVDGDGDPDLYLASYGMDALLVNLGDGRFAERAAAAGLGAGGWSSSAAFADADADGDLDLYVTRYLEYDPELEIFCGDAVTGVRDYCDPSLFLGAADLFYRGAGDGTFAEETAAAGLGGASGRGLGVVFADLDGDGLPDLYVANDLTLNLLFRNRGDGSFEDVSLLSGAAVNRDGRPEAGMGIAVADVDLDGDPELAVTNFDVETNTLYLNHGGLVFEDVSAATGFGPPSLNLLAFGIVPADLDGDGHLDYYLATGHIYERPKRDNVTFAERDQLFFGDGRGGFREAHCPVLADRPTVARGLAVADPDNDGDPDLAIQENGGPLALLRNDGEPSGWLGVELAGASPNTGGVGAVVRLERASGTRVAWVLAGDSYQSSSDRRVLYRFPAGERPPALGVEWPSGRAQRFADPPTGSYLRISEPR